jgi:hypothetical protein
MLEVFELLCKRPSQPVACGLLQVEHIFVFTKLITLTNLKLFSSQMTWQVLMLESNFCYTFPHKTHFKNYFQTQLNYMKI